MTLENESTIKSQIDQIEDAALKDRAECIFKFLVQYLDEFCQKENLSYTFVPRVVDEDGDVIFDIILADNTRLCVGVDIEIEKCYAIIILNKDNRDTLGLFKYFEKSFIQRNIIRIFQDYLPKMREILS